MYEASTDGLHNWNSDAGYLLVGHSRFEGTGIALELFACCLALAFVVEFGAP